MCKTYTTKNIKYDNIVKNKNYKNNKNILSNKILIKKRSLGHLYGQFKQTNKLPYWQFGDKNTFNPKTELKFIMIKCSANLYITYQKITSPFCPFNNKMFIKIVYYISKNISPFWSLNNK